MGLASVFKKGAKTALKVAGDVAKSATYAQVSDNGMDAATSVSITLKVLLVAYSSMEKMVNASIRPTDVSGLIAALDLGDVMPNEGDTVTIGADVYTVVGWETDPAVATYSLQLRKG